MTVGRANYSRNIERSGGILGSSKTIHLSLLLVSAVCAYTEVQENMSGTKDDPSGSSWTRANEVTEAMLGLQPYADDSMLFLMRYGDKVKVRSPLQNSS